MTHPFPASRLLVWLLFCLAPATASALQPQQIALTSPTAAAEADSAARPRLKDLPRDLLRDQKFLWTRPFRLQRADLPGLGLFVGSSAALIAGDRAVAQELTDNPPGAGFRFSHRVEQFGGGLTDFSIAGAFYLIGSALRSNERARATGLLGIRAVTDSLLIVAALKTITQRPRPTRNDGRLRNHNADGEFFTGGRSFPSGHAAQAWALAAVVAEQYKHRGWVPPTAYGLAGLVAVSRITARKHFPADVFVGSVLGYLIGRHVARPAAPRSTDAESTPRGWPCTVTVQGWQLRLALPPPLPGRGGGAALLLTRTF